MANTERNFILWLLREEELSANSAEFDEAVKQYGSGDTDSMYYLDFRQFIGD